MFHAFDVAYPRAIAQIHLQLKVSRLIFLKSIRKAIELDIWNVDASGFRKNDEIAAQGL
jgi:hypothetical protein